MKKPVSQQEIEKPKHAASPKKGGPRIFSMPSGYRGGKEAVLVEKKEAKPPVAVAPKPPMPKHPIAPPVKKKKGARNLVIFGVVFLLVLGAGGYFFLQSTEEPEGTELVGNTPTPPISTTPVPPEPTIPTPTLPDENVSPFPNGIVPGVDSDSDGLSDLEERTVYKTNPALPDTDRDGFLDGNEVFHRYDPNGPSPGTLETAGLATEFLIPDGIEGAIARYRLLYPSIWSATADPEAPWNVSFRATTGEVIRLELEEKQVGESLQSWFVRKGITEKVVSTKTKEGLDMLVSEDKVTAYVGNSHAVMVFHYDTGIKGTVDYLQTFQMMLNSVNWIEETEE